MNINGYTKFVLTKHGAQVWNSSRLPEGASSGSSATVRAGDTLNEQLWVVMEVFGTNACDAFAVDNELTVPVMPGATLPDAIGAAVTAVTYSPEVEAAATLKRMGGVVILAADVESGKMSPAAAKLALMAGGYGAEVLGMVDSLVVRGLDPMAKLAEAQEDSGAQMALVVVYSDYESPRLQVAPLEGETYDRLDQALAAAGSAVYQTLRGLAGAES